ncbi:MAG: methionyl-tRNA formyltransferase [Bacteroides sp.]|nr:methionyl-tRNA formyltransferase [Bacteroides sp.]
MKTPRYCCGQLVNVVGHCVGEPYVKDFFVQCRILCPVDDGSYFVRVEKTDAYSIVEEDSISAYPNYDQDKPADRKRIRIVFFGNGLFALPTLRMLVEQGYDVAAVVTMEDKPCGRGNKVSPSPVKSYAESQGIMVYQPRNLDSDDFLQAVRNLNPTIGVVVEYRILPQVLFKIPKWGIINLHSSLLPMYRGASTITSAIKDGCGMTGVTTFLINSGLDKGNIINNLAVFIAENESAEDIHIKLRTNGAAMVDDAIQRIAHSSHGIPQSQLICDFIKPSHAPKLYRKDAYITWCDSADKVHDFIRAHSSVICGEDYPKNPAIAGSVSTAWTILKMIDSEVASEVKIHKASKTGIPRGFHAPGEWFLQNGKLMVACKDNLIAIDILQFSGKKRMTAKEYLNGFRGVCKGFCQLNTDKEISVQDE